MQRLRDTSRPDSSEPRDAYFARILDAASPLIFYAAPYVQAAITTETHPVWLAL